MRKLLQYFLLSLVLLLVCLSSALLAMRFAIHGREARVPKLVGLTPAEAERSANAAGLVLSVESRFYSAQVPAGHIVSQTPPPDTQVRRGWKVRVAESLGSQRAVIPSVVGQSEHAAEININRRGLEIGTVATIHLAGAPQQTVLAQNPPAEAGNVVSPKIGLVFSAAENGPQYVMPNFVGRSITEARAAVEQAGFSVGKVDEIALPPSDAGNPTEPPLAPGTVLRQSPLAGHKITAGAAVNFEVSR